MVWQQQQQPLGPRETAQLVRPEQHLRSDRSSKRAGLLPGKSARLVETEEIVEEEEE